MSNVTDIRDIHGNRTKAIVDFEYKGHIVSISTMMGNYCDIALFNGDIVDKFATVQQAIEFVNKLTVKMDML